MTPLGRLVGVLFFSVLPAQPADLSGVEARSQVILDHFAARPEKIDGFLAAHAWFARGEAGKGRAAALERSRKLLAKHRKKPVQVDLFHIWPAVDLVARHGAGLDEETKANIREVVLTFGQYKDTTTSNLKTLSWVVRFLGGELYGEEAFAAARTAEGEPVSNDWRPTDRNAGQTLRKHFDTITATGVGEIASRPYFWKNVLPLLSLAQLARDPEIRARAALAYESCLAQVAACWLRGHLGMPTTRSYPDALEQNPSGAESMGFLWVHFGGELVPERSGSAILTAAMLPKVSPLLELAATDRSRPHFARSRNSKFFLQSWVTPEYIVFADGPVGPNSGQVYPNGVVWTDPDRSRYSHLWVTKPIEDDAKLYVSATHGKETRQFKETLVRDAYLAVFDIPQPDPADPSPTPYALGFVPGGYRAVINEAADSGQIFLHYGSVLIAIRSERPFGWDPAGGVTHPSAKPRDGDSEFVIDGDTDPRRPPATLGQTLAANLQFALAVETAAPSEFGTRSPAEQLDAFRAAVRRNPLPRHEGGPIPVGFFTTRHGDRVRLAATADLKANPVVINDRPVDFADWPRLDNPWMAQTDGSRILELRGPGRREALDFSQAIRTVSTKND
jgi:hypothetical protein